MELLEIVNLQFALPIVVVLCLAILVFLFGFRAPIQPPVIAEDVVVALRKSKFKISNKHSKKVVTNHLDTTSSEGAKLQVPVSSKVVVKKPTDKNVAYSTAKVPVTVAPSKSKEENVIDKNAESLKENEWMLATTKKVKKDRLKHKQEHERDQSKIASTVLKESKSNTAAVKEHSTAVVEKASLLATPSQNEVSLKVSGAAVMKQQKKAAEPEVSSPPPTQPREAAQAVVANVNGSVVKQKGEAAVTPHFSALSSSIVSEAATAKPEKSNQSQKKGKKDKQPTAVASLPVAQATSATTPNTKSDLPAAKETKKETALPDERYHQVASKLALEPNQNSVSKKSKKSQKAEKGADEGSSNVAEKERENIVTAQQSNEEQVPANDLNSQEWEEIKAPKKKKKVRLD